MAQISDAALRTACVTVGALWLGALLVCFGQCYLSSGGLFVLLVILGFVLGRVVLQRSVWLRRQEARTSDKAVPASEAPSEQHLLNQLVQAAANALAGRPLGQSFEELRARSDRWAALAQNLHELVGLAAERGDLLQQARRQIEHQTEQSRVTELEIQWERADCRRTRQLREVCDAIREDRFRPADLDTLRANGTEDQKLAQALEGLAGALPQRQAVERVEHAYIQYIAALNHDLNKPLTSIMYLADELQRHRLEHADVAGQIRASGAWMKLLIDSIGDLGEFTAGQWKDPIQPIAVRSLMLDCASMVRPEARIAKGVEIQVDTADDPGTMMGRYRGLRRVLINLIHNAVVSSPEGQSVRLEVERTALGERPGVLFRITDRGCGMSPEELARLFDPHAHVSSSSERRQRGSHLGMAICLEMCRLMEGKIRVAKTEVGKGTIMEVLVPAYLEEPGKPRREPQAAAAGLSQPLA